MRKKLKGILLIAVAAILAPSVVFFLKWIYVRQEFAISHSKIEKVITDWKRNVPCDTRPADWENAVFVIQCAFGNVCFTANEVSTTEMKRLLTDLEEIDQSTVNEATLDWFWNRLGKTGSHGQEYVTRLQPLWDDAKYWMPKKNKGIGVLSD